MRVKIAYTDCPSWVRRHVEAALLVAEGLPNARQVVLDYLLSTIPMINRQAAVRSAESSMAIEILTPFKIIASIELIDP